jgi:hypothetical protein
MSGFKKECYDCPVEKAGVCDPHLECTRNVWDAAMKAKKNKASFGVRIVEILCCADCPSCTDVKDKDGDYYCQAIFESIPKDSVSNSFLDECPLPIKKG